MSKHFIHGCTVSYPFLNRAGTVVPYHGFCHRYLYDTLTKASVVKKKVPVLIFCNKTDKVTAHSKEFIKKQLEKEMYELLPTFSSLALS
jgi:hypothetical protein